MIFRIWINLETPFRYWWVNCVSIIPVPPCWSREEKIVYVGTWDPDIPVILGGITSHHNSSSCSSYNIFHPSEIFSIPLKAFLKLRRSSCVVDISTGDVHFDQLLLGVMGPRFGSVNVFFSLGLQIRQKPPGTVSWGKDQCILG